MKSEDRLLLLLSKVSISEQEANEIRGLLDEGIDWSIVLANAIFNRVLNRIYENVQKLRVADKLNSDIFLTIFKLYAMNAEKAEQYKRQLVEIAKEFDKESITFAIIKGIAVGSKIYGDSNSYKREFSDIDILINKTDLKMAKKIIKRLGFIQGEYNIYTNKIDEISRERELIMQMTSHQLMPYIKEINVCNTLPIKEVLEVDFNFSILDGSDDMELTQDVLRSKEQFELYGYAINTLTKEWMFIQLSTHCYREFISDYHKFKLQDLTLSKLSDFYEFVIRYKNQVDWDKVCEISNRYNISDAIYFSLKMTDYIFHCQEIEEVIVGLNIKNNKIEIFVNNSKEMVNDILFNKHIACHLNKEEKEEQIRKKSNLINFAFSTKNDEDELGE